MIFWVAPRDKEAPLRGLMIETVGALGLGSLTVTFTVALVTTLPELSVARAVIA